MADDSYEWPEGQQFRALALTGGGYDNHSGIVTADPGIVTADPVAAEIGHDRLE